MTNPEAEKTDKMLFKSEQEIYGAIVPADHPFRRLGKIVNFVDLVAPLADCYSDLGTEGIPLETGFKMLLVQFWEDYSDRQNEKAVRENLAVRWFCGFGLLDQTPDHSYFGKLRKRIGTQRLADLFNAVNATLANHGLFGNMFTFIDASSIITKTALWEERDKAIKLGEEKFNNLNVEKYAADKEARWGAKSKKKFWFGYKRHEAVDMRHGLIKNLAVTSADVLDYETVKNICPKQGMVFMDKLFDCKEADKWVAANGCFAATIRKRNNRRKNKDLDRWRSSIRMPFEGTFSKQRKRAKYRGRLKVTFQCFFEAIAFNLKKALRHISQAPMIVPA
jgi:IS5 family transposase